MSCPMSIGAEMQAGKRRSMNMNNLVVSCLVAAYLAANVYAIVKVRVFELARSRKHLILYGVPFILWGSVILLGCKLMEIMRRFDEWAA
jgi:undecaprenyl pyrophosphate phosphatase UppP